MPDDSSRRARHRRAAELLGELLLETTSDERDPESDTRESDSRDADLLRERPPHHDRD